VARRRRRHREASGGAARGEQRAVTGGGKVGALADVAVARPASRADTRVPSFWGGCIGKSLFFFCSCLLLCFMPYRVLYQGTHNAYRRTAAVTKPAHISGVMWRSIEMSVENSYTANCSDVMWRRSQLLPTKKTFSTGLNSGLYELKKHTITPAGSNTATTAWSCTRALSRTRT